jgi:tetratricopeptide (TPR) repeat protein
MVDSTGFQLPPPTDWPAFERIARRLFARIFDCPLAEIVGRSGQDQEGLDIIGRRRDAGRGYFGIQCKLKDDLGANRTLRRKTLEAEVARAEAIEPPLTEFVLATTATNDIDLQKHARALSAARAGGPRPLDIRVIGWDQLRTMIGEYRDILDSFLGIEGVADLSAQSAAQHIASMDASTAQHAELKDMLGQLLAGQPAAHIVAPPLDSEDPKLGRAIDRIKAKLNSNDVRGGLRDLEALREDEWDDASPTHRFRMLSNLGAAHWKLGDYDVATGLFRDAAALKPDDPVALANLAAAATNAGKPEEGLRAARRLLELDPTSSEALLPLIQAQETIAPFDDPLEPVPEAMRDSEEAIVGAAQVLRNRGDETWLALVARGVALHPASDLLARMHADAILYRMAIVDGSHVGAASDGLPSRAELEHAAEVLQRIWRDTLACDPIHPDLSVPHNLAQLLRILERHAEGLAILEEAERYSAETGQIAHLHALLLASLDRTGEAKGRLRANLDDPPARILLCQLLTDDPDEIRSLLSGVAMPEGSREAMWQRVLAAEAHAAVQTGYDPAPEFEAAAQAFPDSLVPLLALGKLAQAPEAREEIAARVIAAATPQTPFPDILQACLWFRESGLPGLAVSLLEERTNRSEDSLPLRWLIEGWFALDDRAALVSALDVLPEPIASRPRYLHFRQRAAYRTGDMAGSLAAVDRLIETQPDDLGLRLDWIHIKHRLHDRQSVDAWLATEVEKLDGSPDQRADLALLLANHGYYDRARRLAYRLARLDPDNRRVLERYTGVVMNPVPAGPSELGLSRVGPDAVFTVTDEQGVDWTYRIDAERDLPAESIDLRPDAPVALAAEGMGKGDCFEIDAGLAGMPPKRFRIGNVMHKHIHLFRWLTDVLPNRFDGPTAIYKASVDPENGSGLEVLVGHLQEQETLAREINADYLQTARALRIIAALTDRSIIDTYDTMTALENGAFVCSDGGGAEFDLECQAIPANRRSGCVADTITMEIIRRHELLDVVTAVAGPISIAQATLDDFIDRAHKGDLLVGRYRGNLSQRDGKLVPERIHPAHIDVAIDVRRSALDWLQSNTRVRAAVGPPGLARQLAAMLPDELSGQFQDEVLIAAETGLLLLTDDLGYRRFAGSAGIRRKAGLPALLRVALVRGALDLTRYVATIAALGRARHRFIAADSEDLVEALEQDGGVVGPVLRGVANLFGGAGANLAVQWHNASGFLRALWEDEAMVPHRMAVATLLADRFLISAPEARRAFSVSLFRDPDDALSAFERAVALAIRENAGPAAEL